jgi:hypothetical protein
VVENWVREDIRFEFNLKTMPFGLVLVPPIPNSYSTYTGIFFLGKTGTLGYTCNGTLAVSVLKRYWVRVRYPFFHTGAFLVLINFYYIKC